MINTHTVSAIKTLQPNYRSLSQSPNNILSVGNSGSTDTHAIAQNIPTTSAFSKVFAIGPATTIKIIVMMAGGVNTNVIRITGWTKADNGYFIPQILWLGAANTLGTVASMVGYSSLFPVVTFGAPTAGYTASTATNALSHYQLLGSSGVSPGSLVLNTLGNQLIEIELLGAAAVYTAVENVPIVLTAASATFTFPAGAFTGILTTAGTAVTSTIRVASATNGGSIGSATHVTGWSTNQANLNVATGVTAGNAIVSVGPVWNAFVSEF